MCDRIRMHCHTSSRGEGHMRTTKTGCLVKVRLVRCQDIYRVGSGRELVHNHPLLTLPHPNIPHELEATIQDLLKSGVEKDRIIEFVQLRAGRLLSRYQLAVLGSPDVRLALASDTDDLIEYMSDKGSCHVLEMPMG
jgi:hypothetical protein